MHVVMLAGGIGNVNECVAIALRVCEWERRLARPKSFPRSFICEMRWGDPPEAGTGKKLAAQGTKGPLKWRQR